MNTSFLILLVFAFIAIGYLLGSIKIIPEGDMALVVRLGKYTGTLKPGINFVVPALDIVLVETSREQILDVAPWLAWTRDQTAVHISLILYWRIVDLYRAYYKVQDLENSLQNLVIGEVNYEIERREVNTILISKREISEKLKDKLSQTTLKWGVEITNLVIQEISPTSNLSDTDEKNVEEGFLGNEVSTLELRYRKQDLLNILEKRVFTLRDLSIRLEIPIYTLRKTISALRQEGYIEIEDAVIEPDSNLLISKKGIEFLHSATS
jgi:regulator of protease activity HflC (stomatin/prohibitin superfamily)